MMDEQIAELVQTAESHYHVEDDWRDVRRDVARLVEERKRLLEASKRCRERLHAAGLEDSAAVEIANEAIAFAESPMIGHDSWALRKLR